MPVVDVDLAPSQRWELYRVLSEPAAPAAAGAGGRGGAEHRRAGRAARARASRTSRGTRRRCGRRGSSSDRREGTRTLVRARARGRRATRSWPTRSRAGGRSASATGASRASPTCVRAREARRARVLRATGRRRRLDAIPAEIGAYLAALAPLLPRRGVALDAGTGDGRLLEVLAPVYERVVARRPRPARSSRARASAWRRAGSRT